MVFQGCYLAGSDLREVTLVNIDHKMEQHSDVKAVTNDDLVAFMKAMRTTTENLTETLSREIREGRSEMKKDLENITKNIDEVKAENKKTEEKNDKRMTRLEHRIEAIETERKSSEQIKRKRDPNTTEKTGTGKPAGGEQNVWMQPNKIRQNENDENIERHKRAAHLEAERLQKDKKNQERAAAAAAARRLEDQRKKEKELKPVKLGDSSDSGNLHGDEDWSWDESEGDWPDSVDRVERNREKKRAAWKKKKDRQDRVTQKNQFIIGIGPVYQKSIDHFNSIVGDYMEAKRMAAMEYLKVSLRYNEEELEEVEITDTQVSAKSENILYIVTAKASNIRDIRARLAECRDERLNAIDFIPPQYYARYTALGRVAKDIRDKDRSMKTQIRFGQSDLELYTKRKGSDDRYTPVPLDTLDAELPKFDHSLRWRRRDDRPPRRKVSPTRDSCSHTFPWAGCC